MASAVLPAGIWEEFDAAFEAEILGLKEEDHWWYVRGETVIS
jgi:hypothetical protein